MLKPLPAPACGRRGRQTKVKQDKISIEVKSPNFKNWVSSICRRREIWYFELWHLPAYRRQGFNKICQPISPLNI
jgi:hypothetical protein